MAAAVVEADAVEEAAEGEVVAEVAVVDAKLLRTICYSYRRPTMR